MADYEFRYSPLTGRLTGNQMIEQTEQAINALASQVDSAAGQVEIISTLANEANENAANALETAEEALATTGRTYITVSTQTDADNYYDSQLIYIADSTSTNIPVADTGMLEVKTNDNKTACEQVFIADSSGDAYYRNGEITAETVGDVTTYTVTWGGWSSQPASQAYVQGELTNYTPLSGGTITGDLSVNGTFSGSTGVLAGNLLFGDSTGDNFLINNTPQNGAFLETYAGSSLGARLALCHMDNTSSAGRFELDAKNGSNTSKLIGSPDGSLTWGGYNVCTDRLVSGTMTALKGSFDSSGNALRYMGRWVECSVRMWNISGTVANTWNNLVQLPSEFIPQMEFDFAGVNNTAGTCVQVQITPAGVIRVWGQVTTFRCHVVYIRKE